MPFDYKDYSAKCDSMSTEQLHKEWDNYTRQISGGATSTATSVMFAPVTGGVSLVGLGLSAPKIHNARKKRAIIEAGLKARGATHNTRKRDVIAPMAITGAVSGLTLGLAGPAANMMAGQVVGHGIEYATAHVALDAGAGVLEHQHGKHHHNKANEKLQAQYENFKIQYSQEQAAAQGIQLPMAGYQPGLQIPGSVNGPQPATPLSPAGTNISPPPPSQPQGPSQDQKYEYVPVPGSYNTKPQQSTTFTGALQSTTYQVTQYQQANFPTHSPAQQFPRGTEFPPEKPPILSHPYTCPTPLPLYSPPQTAAVHHQPPPPQHRPSLPTPTITPHTPVHRPSLPSGPTLNPSQQKPSSPIYEMPTSTGRTTPTRNDSMLSMEEELALLRMKILQMELEKRGEPVEIELDDDEIADADEEPKAPEVPEIFPTEAFAPEPPRKSQTNPDPKLDFVEVEQAADGPKPSSPKLNPFVDLQQPTPLKVVKPPGTQNTLPYPTFSTPQPEKQQQYRPPPQQGSTPPAAPDPSAQPTSAQQPAKTGLSITGGISITYNRDSAPIQPPTSNQAQTVPQEAPASAVQYQQASTPPYVPPPQPATTYQTYNPQQQAQSIPMSPLQQAASQSQGAPISYTPTPPLQQQSVGFQAYNPVNQTPSTPNIQYQQQTYQQPPKPPLQHQDSGYYSNPPNSRHSSTFSVSTVASISLDHVVSPPTPSYATLSPQTPQQQYGHTHRASYGQMPMTQTPSPMSPPPPPEQQNYYPPSFTTTPAPTPANFFGQNNVHRVSTPNPQIQSYNPAQNYGNVQNGNYQPGTPALAPAYGGQQQQQQQQSGNWTKGWQWGIPSQKTGAPAEPNYGPPPPIPGQWKGS